MTDQEERKEAMEFFAGLMMGNALQHRKEIIRAVGTMLKELYAFYAKLIEKDLQEHVDNQGKIPMKKVMEVVEALNRMGSFEVSNEE